MNSFTSEKFPSIFGTYNEIFGSNFQGFTESFGPHFNPKVAGLHQSEV